MSQGGTPQREAWGTRIGVILAVTGSAVGLGNFLRFPGLAAQYGGGVFMIPYVVAFLLIGLPIAWVEWSMGRFGGARGYNSAPGVFRAITGSGAGSYLAMLGPLIPVVIYMYYVYIEAWCLGYAWNYLVSMSGMGTGLGLGADAEAYGTFFSKFVGEQSNGASFSIDGEEALLFLGICFVLNFFLIYRGLNKGIEWFCKLAMPALVLCALIVLGRVLTLGIPDPEKPDQSLMNGLGYMWNPVHRAEDLAPGDASVQSLAQRSTVDAITGIDKSATGWVASVADRKAFDWALAATGWKAKPRKESAKTTGPPTATLYYHDDSPVRIRVEGDRAVLDDDGGDDGLADDDQVKALLAMLPVHVADARRNAKTFSGFNILNDDGFVTALEATGWENDADRSDGRWSHAGSRMLLEVDGDQANVGIPGFLETLANPEIWLAAAGQIFFSLSVGFGIIVTYSSYMKPDDDVALSSLTAAAGNGFCEVVLGGLITIPATFIFLGVTAVANPPGTFGMGFVSLPNVFNQMGILGPLFGFLFFFLLFLAAVTSSLSMLQPAIALFEEGLGIGRKASVAMLGFITLFGSMFVVFFSKGLLAMDTLDFWVGSVCIFLMATVQVILFGWVLGLDRGMKELRRGAEIPVPAFVGFVIKYVSPVYLLVIFGLWLVNNLPGRIMAIGQVEKGQPPVVALALGLIAVVLVFFILIINRANARWDRQKSTEKEVSP